MAEITIRIKDTTQKAWLEVAQCENGFEFCTMEGHSDEDYSGPYVNIEGDDMVRLYEFMGDHLRKQGLI